MRCLFFGSDEFSLHVFRRLLSSPLPSRSSMQLHVVTPPDSPRTRIPEVPLKTFARTNGITHHIAPPKTLANWSVPPLPYDLAIVVSFGYFLPKHVVRAFPLGAVNVHPSLLPKYRGAAPIQHTILNEDVTTGVSIIEIHESEFDAGKILRQTAVDVPPYVYYKDLHDMLAEQGSTDLIETITDLDFHRRNGKAQDVSKVTKAPKISKHTTGLIDFAQSTAHEIFTLHRAVGYRVPLHVDFRGKRLQLCAIENPDLVAQIHLGRDRAVDAGGYVFDRVGRVLHVRCNGGGWLGLSRVKVEGKREVDVVDFVNGYQLPDVGRLS